MASNSRGDNATKARRHEVSRLIPTGATEREMATTLKVSQPTIHSDIKIVMAEWRGERFETLEDYVTRELRKLDDLELRARHYWNREQKRAGENGDPDDRWWLNICRIVAQRSKLLGLDGPQKVEHTVKIEDLRNQIAAEAAKMGLADEVDAIMATSIQLANEPH